MPTTRTHDYIMKAAMANMEILAERGQELAIADLAYQLDVTTEAATFALEILENLHSNITSRTVCGHRRFTMTAEA